MYRTAPEKKLVKVSIVLTRQQVVNAIFKYVQESPQFSDNIPDNVKITLYANDQNGRACARLTYEAERLSDGSNSQEP